MLTEDDGVVTEGEMSEEEFGELVAKGYANVDGPRPKMKQTRRETKDAQTRREQRKKLAVKVF